MGVALLVVLETLAPAERFAFVLHDRFAVPFDDIAPMIERTPEATRQLASRARRRVLRSDGGAKRPNLNVVLRGAQAVASQARTARKLSPFVRPVLVNVTPGVVVAANGTPLSVMAFSVVGGRIVAIDVLADPDRLKSLDLGVLD